MPVEALSRYTYGNRTIVVSAVSPHKVHHVYGCGAFGFHEMDYLRIWRTVSNVELFDCAFLIPERLSANRVPLPAQASNNLRYPRLVYKINLPSCSGAFINWFSMCSILKFQQFWPCGT